MVEEIECWYNLNIKKCLRKTGKGLKGQYATELHKLINSIPDGRVIDLGCGSGKMSKFFKDYTGVDLPKTVKNIGKVMSPKVNFIECDLIKDDISFIGEYDIVFMDAFIDVMSDPLRILSRVLLNSNNYVLLIRQEIGKETKITRNPSYGGWTYHSVIGMNDLYKVLEVCGFRIVQVTNNCIAENWNNFILQKDE